MNLHIPGSPGEQALNAMNDILHSASGAVQQKYRDDRAKGQKYLQLAFEWRYYLDTNEAITVDTLVRDYGVLRAASPHDIEKLQERLKPYKL